MEYCFILGKAIKTDGLRVSVDIDFIRIAREM
jgi:hypothetical protein